jgi:predicted dehydrogenase
MDMDFAGLVLGYGSIGRRHTQVLSTITPALVIVDGKESSCRQAAQDHPAARVVERLEALDDVDFPWPHTLAVIATWGPSHASLFHALADRGVRHILCEKPLAASVALAEGMVHRAATERIVLAVNHDIRYARLAPALWQYLAEQGLGEPVALVVAAGAACLVTNGIHWVDFASELFGGAPRQVVSTAVGQPINPRSPELGFYGGTAVWRFDAGREAVISFSNRSSLAPSARLYLRDAVVDIDMDLNVDIRRRDRAAVAQFPAITRTGPAQELLFAGRLPKVRSFLDGLHAAAREVLSSEVRTSPGAVGAAAVGACIGALLAGREGQAIALPIDPTSPAGQEIWPIS